jgi:hypothetical protein
MIAVVSLLYVGVTLCMWPKHPAQLLLIPPLLWAIQALGPRLHASLFAVARSRKGLRILLAVTGVLLAARLGIAVHKVFGPLRFIEDIAYAYGNAIRELVSSGANPYTAAVDPSPMELGGYSYVGLKYTPLQLVTYAPFVLTPRDERDLPGQPPCLRGHRAGHRPGAAARFSGACGAGTLLFFRGRPCLGRSF